MNKFSIIPAINEILESEAFLQDIENLGREQIKNVAKDCIDEIRRDIINGQEYTAATIVSKIRSEIEKLNVVELKSVINCTGVLLHTNLGRAVLDQEVMAKVSDLMTNYANVEFDLTTGKRGKRGEYVNQLLCTLTGAEAALVVNNNAGAVFLILNEFAKDKEVLVSRGELVEIGGSFRIPNIMRESGAILREIGTTNKTKPSDYQANINANTAMIMKVHQSNFQIVGFTEEVGAEEITKISKDKNIISYYDMGSGLLNKPITAPITWEHTVKEIVSLGTNLVSFSGDKLLGATQAGLIVGKRELIERLKKNQLYRILRVGKLTDSVIYYTLKKYLDFQTNIKQIPFFQMITQTEAELLVKVQLLQTKLNNHLSTSIVENRARTGGGSMPGETFASQALQIDEANETNVKAHHELMNSAKPIITFLKEGKLMVDTLTVKAEDLDYLASELIKVYKAL